MSAMEDISQETVQRLRAQAEAENISLDALVNRMLTDFEPAASHAISMAVVRRVSRGL